MGSALGAMKVAASRRGMTLDQYKLTLASGQKWCSRGKHWRELRAFNEDRTRGDGLSVLCGPCRVEYKRQARKADREKARARSRLSSKKIRGTMPRASALRCTDCGEPASDYDHHNGYSKEHALDVQPVCRPCHVKRGIARGELGRRRTA